MNNNPLMQVLLYFLSNIRTFLFRTLIWLIFGFLFLIFFHAIEGNSVYNHLSTESFDFIKIDFSSHEKILQSIVIAYTLGLLLDVLSRSVFKIYYFSKRKISGWLKKSTKASGFQDLGFDDVRVHEYLEIHPYVADVYALEQFISSISRPLFGIVVSISLLVSNGVFTLLLVVLSLVLFIFGLDADKQANKFTRQIVARLKEQKE